MVRKIDRSQFLRGTLWGRRPPLRPPWSGPEVSFIDFCRRGGACIDACPEGILIAGRGRLPEVDFARGECSFCGKCAQVCPTGALSLANAVGDADGAQRPWTATAAPTDACLSMKGVSCRVCAEHCEAGAIRFALAVGGGARPVIEPALCSGCGACVAPCPADAIEVA